MGRGLADANPREESTRRCHQHRGGMPLYRLAVSELKASPNGLPCQAEFYPRFFQFREEEALAIISSLASRISSMEVIL
jgi:hypothetical protein